MASIKKAEPREVDSVTKLAPTPNGTSVANVGGRWMSRERDISVFTSKNLNVRLHSPLTSENLVRHASPDEGCSKNGGLLAVMEAIQQKQRYQISMRK